MLLQEYRTPPRFNSDTSDMVDSRNKEGKYEHTNHSCNQKTPMLVPRLWGGLGGGGPSAFSPVVQTELLYFEALLSRVTA